MEKVTLLSLANSIEQLSRQFQSLVQCLEDNHNSPSKVFKVFGSTSKTPNVPKVLQHSSEKTKTDSSIAKTGPRHIVNQINLPGLKLPICVPVHFKPTAAMDLDYDELAIAAYLYGNTLMYNDEEELVLSYGTRAHRDVFRSLFPDREIQDEVLMLVAKMMSEMTIESGYWFLPPYFADSQRTRMDPCCMGFLITEICLGKDDCFKRVFIPVSEMNKECRKHWYLVVVDRVERQVILLDPNPTKFKDRRRKTAINLATYLEDVLDPLNSYYDSETTPTFSTIGYGFVELEGTSKLKDESNDAGVWVASWMMTCVDASNFNIEVDEVNRMKIAVSLVLKDHNIIEHSIKTKAIANLQL